MSGPESGKVHAEAHTHAPEKKKKAAEDVGQTQKDIADAVHKTVPESTKPEPPIMEAWKPLPRPNTRALATTAIAAAAIVNPVATATIGAGAYGYKKLSKYPPFKWLNRGVARGASVVGDAARSTKETALFPFRFAGRLSANVLGVGGRILSRTYSNTVGRLFNGVKAGMDAKLNVPEGSGATATAVAGERAVAKRLWESGKGAVKYTIEHPVKAAIIGYLGYTALTNPAAVLAAGQSIFDSVVQLAKGIVNKALTPVP